MRRNGTWDDDNAAEAAERRQRRLQFGAATPAQIASAAVSVATRGLDGPLYATIPHGPLAGPQGYILLDGRVWVVDDHAGAAARVEQWLNSDEISMPGGFEARKYQLVFAGIIRFERFMGHRCDLTVGAPPTPKQIQAIAQLIRGMSKVGVEYLNGSGNDYYKEIHPHIGEFIRFLRDEVGIEVAVPNPARYRDYIRGEWWITEHGDAEFADQDVGEAGHELIAADMLLSKDALVEGLRDAEIITDEEAEEYERNDETTAGHLFFEYENLIPDEVGTQAAGSAEVWADMKQDIRLAYAKHRNAILVINTSFYVWKLDKDAIRRIQDFLMGELSEHTDGEDELLHAAADTSICLEEGESQRHVCVTIEELMLVKYPPQLWRGNVRQAFLPGFEENPGRKHVKGKLPAKAQRMYEHIRDSYLERGADQETAKSIAAATVNKFYGGTRR